MADCFELRCKECGKTWGNVPKSFCEDCFSPLEVSFDYTAIKKKVRREDIASRSVNMWRYSEFLPLSEGFTPPNAVGGTPLVAARKLAKRLGVRELFVKNDAVCFPSLSFKDRVVATALAAARRFGFETVGCSPSPRKPRSKVSTPASSSLRTSSPQKFSTPPSTARASSASTATTITSIVSAPRSLTASNGAW
jgi:threonine synthase